MFVKPGFSVLHLQYLLFIFVHPFLRPLTAVHLEIMLSFLSKVPFFNWSNKPQMLPTDLLLAFTFLNVMCK